MIALFQGVLLDYLYKDTLFSLRLQQQKGYILNKSGFYVFPGRLRPKLIDRALFTWDMD